jgi:aminopeptidase N
MQTVSRLIDQFIPEHYQLSVTINRTERTFTGIVTINGHSPESTGSIAVHAKDLAIESATIDGKRADFTVGSDDELTIIHPDIHAGRHLAVIAFSGTITDGMHGVYPCYYEHDGIKKEIIATQFESHHARECFPCIDEPEAKATFDVILTTEQGLTALSNMPIKQQKIEDDRLVTSFDTTPRMSTYLLAWVAGEFHRKTAVTKSGVEVNVWATLAQPADSLDFALDFAVRSIDFFNDYFGTPYPLAKSDHVALPDFSAAAMENWGLITYREMALLVEPKTTSVSSKHYIAGVIAHELSHQWFGNLVTMKWWNNLWLNESFATLMQHLCPDALHPDWNSWLDFATSDSISALRRDSLEGVQPVQLDVNHPDEIGTLFDPSIVYAKGARLMRMLQSYIGSDAFQAGLKAYFATHKYGNTTGDDLWNALEQASGKPIGGFMNTWITQAGYPVVHATQTGDQLTLSQEQFFVGRHVPSEKVWPIPLGASDKTIPELFDTQSITVTRTEATPLHLNNGDTAHFITHYDDGLLSRLINSVEANELAPLDRLQLLHEQTLLARGEVISGAALIPLLQAYKHETAEAVWDIIGLAIGELKKFVEADEIAEKKLRNLAGQLAHEQYKRLGWEQREDETQTDTKLRATIIGMMLYSEDQAVIDHAFHLYSTNELEQLDPELRSLIIGTAVRHHHSDALIDTLITTYATTPSAELQQDIAGGLTSTRNASVIRRLLECIKDGVTVRPQDATHWFIWLIRNRDGRTLAWQWLQDNWSWIEKTFDGDKSYDAFTRYSASALVSRQQLEQYRTFFTPMLNDPSLSRVIAIGIGEIEGRVELIERDGEAVCQALIKL